MKCYAEAWAGAAPQLGELVSRRKKAGEGTPPGPGTTDDGEVAQGDFGRAATVISRLEPHAGNAESRVGSQVGPYRLEAVLGQGSMAQVYRVVHQESGLAYAMKVLDSRLARDHEMLARFRSEGAVAKRVESDHVVRTLENGVLPTGEPYLVMELLEGRSLAELMRDGPCPPGEARDVLLQLCEVLAASHARGIVHRDLKPENIFLQHVESRLPFVKLMDFGLARHGDAPGVTRHGALIGTPAYMAPEQCAAQPADARADLYALGVIAFELTTGQKPFPGTSAIAVMMAHLQTPAPSARSIRPELSETWEAVLARALAKSPADRFQSATELARAIASALPEGDAFSVQQRKTPRLLVDLEARLSIHGGAAQPTRVAELAAGGAFVVTPHALAPGAPLRLAIALLGPEWIDAQVVRASPQGLAVRFTHVPEGLRPRLDARMAQLRSASAFPRPPALERFAGPPANIYELLALPLDAPLAQLAAAAGALSKELDEAAELCREAPISRDWEVARQLLDAWLPATGSLLARTAYDAGLGNWRGVARSLEEGLPDSERGSLQAARRAQNPALDIQIRFHLGRAALAESARDSAGARQELEAALELDPLDRELLRRWAALARMRPG